MPRPRYGSRILDTVIITDVHISVLISMNYLLSSSKTLETEQKSPVVPKKLTKAELRDAVKDLTYLLPGMFTSVPTSKSSRRGKGKKNRGGEAVHFPSP